MEVMSNEGSCKLYDTSLEKNGTLQVSSNWQINNNKHFHDTITTVLLSEVPSRTDFEEVVSLDTCIALQPNQSDNEPCMIDIKVTNQQRIARIAIVSEAYVLEFFKQFGEYSNTVFAEFIDEFEGNSVYFAETTIEPYTTEASIKFTKTKNRDSIMWIYGIRLVLTEAVKEIRSDMFNYDVIKSFLINSNEVSHKEVDMSKKVMESSNSHNNHVLDDEYCQKKISMLTINSAKQCKTENKVKYNEREDMMCNCAGDAARVDTSDIRTYIDNKFDDLETRLMQKIDEMQYKTNQKLDAILKSLEVQLNAK